jgi:hypothetical protein
MQFDPDLVDVRGVQTVVPFADLYLLILGSGKTFPLVGWIHIGLCDVCLIISVDESWPY